MSRRSSWMRVPPKRSPRLPNGPTRRIDLLPEPGPRGRPPGRHSMAWDDVIAQRAAEMRQRNREAQ